MPGQSVGSTIGAVFGLVFVQVNAGSLPAGVQWPLRVLAVLAFLAVLVALYVHRGHDDTASSDQVDGIGFGRAYWTVTALEVVALFAGTRVISGPLDAPDAAIGWVSVVVGVHFFALAMVFGASFFHVLGAAITLCGAAGLALYAAGAGEAAVDVAGGILPGAILLGFGWWGATRAYGRGRTSVQGET